MDMTVRAVGLLSMWLVLPGALAPAAKAQDAPAQANVIVWTGIIPDRFPRNIYTWRLASDGTYEEDAINAVSSRSAQQTYSGCWKADAMRMVLRQSKIPYVFAGVVSERLYSGTLYLNGRPVSRFCAAKSDQPPRQCEPWPAVVDVSSLQTGCGEPVADATRSKNAHSDTTFKIRPQDFKVHRQNATLGARR